MRNILKITFLLTLLFSFQGKAQDKKSQIIKDTLFGKPKFVKEYVLFLNGSGPYTFMKGDGEYGHATKMEPKSLRKRMADSWFGSYICRYINNETYYDKNRNITKEIWYYKSGEIVNDYNYTYDNLNRLVTQKSKNDYSELSSRFFYDKNNKDAKFEESNYRWKDKSIRYVTNLESYKPLFFTKFDSSSKSDSIFAITNDIWKKVAKGYAEGKDSIYHKKISGVKIYDEEYKVIEEKQFDYKNDYPNKKTTLARHMKYEYDESGNVIKQIDFKDDKVSSYIVFEDGKIMKEEKFNELSTFHTAYSYTKDQKLERKIIYYNNKVGYDIKFEYKDNYISKLYYLDKLGREDQELEPTIVIFKYKFDKQKNWTEIVKNVDGKDLYKWVREIEYYK